MMNMNYQSIRNLLQRAIKKMRSTFSDRNFSVKISIEKDSRYL